MKKEMTDEATQGRELIKKHYREMPDNASASTGNKSVLSEDINDFLEKICKAGEGGHQCLLAQ